MLSLEAWGGLGGGERTFLSRKLFQALREMGTEVSEQEEFEQTLLPMFFRGAGSPRWSLWLLEKRSRPVWRCRQLTGGWGGEF